MDLLSGVSDAVLMPRILAYYRQAAPLIAASFGGSPLVFKNYPGGVDQPGVFHVLPFAVSVDRILWAIHARYAVEYYSWAPLPEDEDRLRFARILIEPPDAVPFARVKAAAQAVRALLLAEARLGCVAMLDGVSGIALWVPLADAPAAAAVREWLHRVCNRAAVLHPELISTEANTHRDGRVHLHVSSNAPRHFSAVPYSLRVAGLAVCAPVRWDELDGCVRADAFDAQTMPARWASQGDVFASEVAALGEQRFDGIPAGAMLARVMATTPGPRGHIITAAIEILDDGKARTAQELLAEALKRGLVPAGTTPHYIYTALFEYIGRQLGRGRKPPIVQDAQRRFRINEPADDWPDFAADSAPAGGDGVQALCDRLEATATATDPAAFEAAVCDAFARLGFLAQHLGQHGQPDGVADAILGALGYRVLLECKTAKTIVSQPDAAEVAKFREAFGADRCVLVGPDFSGELELLSELQTHRVCALSVGVLQTLLHIGADALEVRRVLEPGFASDLIGDVLWERRHGAAKRVATVARLVVREGWRAQVTAAEQGGPGNAPRLTVDAAMVLVDAALRAVGSAQACTRAEVEAAFAWLTSDCAGLGVRDGDEVVVLRPGGLA
jgi:DNA primase